MPAMLRQVASALQRRGARAPGWPRGQCCHARDDLPRRAHLARQARPCSRRTPRDARQLPNSALGLAAHTVPPTYEAALLGRVGAPGRRSARLRRAIRAEMLKASGSNTLTVNDLQRVEASNGRHRQSSLGSGSVQPLLFGRRQVHDHANGLLTEARLARPSHGLIMVHETSWRATRAGSPTKSSNCSTCFSPPLRRSDARTRSAARSPWVRTAIAVTPTT